jgi:hypothetical protein
MPTESVRKEPFSRSGAMLRNWRGASKRKSTTLDDNAYNGSQNFHGICYQLLQDFSGIIARLFLDVSSDIYF